MTKIIKAQYALTAVCAGISLALFANDIVADAIYALIWAVLVMPKGE